MADPRHYSISIIENYSDKSLQEIALAVTKKIEKDVSEDDFTLWDAAEGLELGTNFLTTEEAYTWYFAADDLLPTFTDFPDVCFCLSVGDGEGGGQYRVLFFNGKYVKQYPEIRYEEFRPNDFEYQASDKTPLKKAEKEVEEVISHVCNKIAASMTEEHDPELLGLIRQNLFGDIILENRQDA
jgi:hypothetical protein